MQVLSKGGFCDRTVAWNTNEHYETRLTPCTLLSQILTPYVLKSFVSKVNSVTVTIPIVSVYGK
jgi:hypothetical protein